MKKIANYMKQYYVRIFLIISAVLLVFACFTPILFSQIYTGIDFSETGSIGDTISGTMSPVIGIVSIIITFLAFYIQYLANKDQREQINIQRKEIAKQETNQLKAAFENNLFQLLKFHRENVENLEYVNINGFAALIRYIACIDTMFIEIHRLYPDENRKNVLTYAYLLFYYGESLAENSYLNHKHSDTLRLFANTSVMYYVGNYVPGKYQKTGLGHYVSTYYRHLFQIYKYLDKCQYLDKTDMNRYDYARIIRSNITNDEQLFLFYNMVVPVGHKWIDDDYVIKYKPLKNISINSVKTYSPIEWMKTISDIDIEKKEMFEYYE